VEQIKKYFKEWGFARIIRLIFAIILGVAYANNGEQFYLFFGIILFVQAAFNISCPGGSCSTGTDRTTKPVIKTEKYEHKK
jgi:hypothetical protein